jgi:hypothetical protein
MRVAQSTPSLFHHPFLQNLTFKYVQINKQKNHTQKYLTLYEEINKGLSNE